MKILTLNSNLKGIGTYLRCYYFSRELARLGHEVTMVTVSQTSRYRPRTYFKRGYLGEYAQPCGEGPWIRMVEAPSLGYKWMPGWGSGPLDIGWRTRELWRGGYDLVYGFEYQPNVAWPFYAARHWRTFRFVSDWCDWHAGQSNHLRGWRLAHRVDGFLEERIRFLAQAVTVISQTLHRRAASIGIDPRRIVDVPEGIDTDYLRDYPTEQARTRCGLPVDRPVVAAVRDGDMSRVIRIFAQVRRRVPAALLLVIGNVGAAVRATAQALGVGDSVQFAGRVSDEAYPDCLGCADVCVLPLTDGTLNQARFPAKLLDYLASARPVVTNPVGDVAGLFRTQSVGIACGQADEEIADAVCGLLDDPERARHLGLTAREVMLREWDWKLRGKLIAGAVDACA
jgi:glycosyltransferase involved in cell wall biosynthesis